MQGIRMSLITLSPFVCWMLSFLTIPLVLVVFVSFCMRGEYGDIQFQFTLHNYTRILSPLYLKILWNSLKISFLTTAICLLIGYPFASIIARAPQKYRNMLLLLTIIPFWTNSLVRTYAWIILLRTEGVINTVLKQWGIIQKPLAMMYNEGAIFIGMVYTLLPFMIMPLYASLEKLDRTYLEAAADLGATPWQSFWKITVPLTMPGIIAGSLLVFVPALGIFFIPDLMGGSKIMLVSNLIKNQFLTSRDWPFGSALSIVLIGITLIFITVYLRVTGSKKDAGVF